MNFRKSLMILIVVIAGSEAAYAGVSKAIPADTIFLALPQSWWVNLIRYPLDRGQAHPDESKWRYGIALDF